MKEAEVAVEEAEGIARIDTSPVRRSIENTLLRIIIATTHTAAAVVGIMGGHLTVVERMAVVGRRLHARPSVITLTTVAVRHHPRPPRASETTAVAGGCVDITKAAAALLGNPVPPIQTRKIRRLMMDRLTVHRRRDNRLISMPMVLRRAARPHRTLRPLYLNHINNNIIIITPLLQRRSRIIISINILKTSINNHIIIIIITPIIINMLRSRNSTNNRRRNSSLPYQSSLRSTLHPRRRRLPLALDPSRIPPPSPLRLDPPVEEVPSLRRPHRRTPMPLIPHRQSQRYIFS